MRGRGGEEPVAGRVEAAGVDRAPAAVRVARGNRNDANCAATCSIWGDTNLILCVTHSLYAVGP